MDIDKLLRDIDAHLRQERERREEPVTLALAPMAQRVREFLAVAASPVWLNAPVISYTVPAGWVHAALDTQGTGFFLLVFEDISGNLSQMFAFGVDDTPLSGRK